jgi:hypothetical protein
MARGAGHTGVASCNYPWERSASVVRWYRKLPRWARQVPETSEGNSYVPSFAKGCNRDRHRVDVSLDNILSVVGGARGPSGDLSLVGSAAEYTRARKAPD